MTVTDTIEQRAIQHGNYKKNTDLAEGIMEVIESSVNWPHLPRFAKYTIKMIVVKLARILTGNALFAEHWHDIAGYATLAEREISHISDEAL